MVKNITFGQLMPILAERAGQPGSPSKTSLPNCVSALNGFLQERGLTDTVPVGSTLRKGFAAARDGHLHVLFTAGRSINYVANRRYYLGAWHLLVRMLDHEGAALDGTWTPLQQALRELTAGRKASKLAREIALPIRTLQSWIAGCIPRPGNERYLVRLESICAVARGALTELLPYKAHSRLVVEKQMPTIEWRERLSKQLADPYRLKPDEWPGAQRAQWSDLLCYKISAPNSHSELPGAISGGAMFTQALAVPDEAIGKQWRLKPAPPGPPRADLWIDTVGGLLCPTADVQFKTFSAFFGWARLSPDRGGADIPTAKLSLGMVTDVPLVTAYGKWRANRSGGINSGIDSFLASMLMLCDEETGFLQSRPDIGAGMGFTDPKAWIEHCNHAHGQLKTMQGKIARASKPSRDPKEPIRHALELSLPLEPFLKGVKALESARPNTGGIREALWGRDLLLMAVLTSNPLRLCNLQALTYRADGTGHLRKTSTGWRIFIAAKEIKNGDTQGDYDQGVDEAVWPYIERYLKTYRRLLGTGSDLVFVSKDNPTYQWATMSKHFQILTRRHVPGSPGVGVHAMRHVVATHVIVFAEGNYLWAAGVLHDAPETVKKHYSHLLKTFVDRGRDKALGEVMKLLH